jgi:Tudor domain
MKYFFQWNNPDSSQITNVKLSCHNKSNSREPGSACLALYLEDNCYYRARILKRIGSTDAYKVFFVDYGTTEIVPLECVSLFCLNKYTVVFCACIIS